MIERIGKYEVRKLLGEGSTAAVYLAYDPFAQREVAVKQFHQEVLHNPERGRLYRHLLLNEASLAGKLMHPHIVQIMDAAVDDEFGYVVMEYVPGGTLEAWTQPDRLLPFDRLIEIIFKCSRALDYAYHIGITHRDIKPANILLTSPEGQDIKLTDFGSALFTAADTTQVSGVGSPAYMSPQQVLEQPLDHRTDIYSLGVVMYQLLCGRLPFEASNNYSLLYRIAHDTPSPPSTYRAEIPAALDGITARALSRDLAARYQSWGEFSHDLAQAFRNRSFEVPGEAFPDAQKFQALRGMHFFRPFNDVQIWEVVGLTEWSHLPPGTEVMTEGASGQHFCFLVEGEARVKKHGRHLQMLSAGDCFGEMALFSPAAGIRSATVETTTRARLITLHASALQRATDGCRMHFYQAFLEVLANRLALANVRIVSI
jgi:serine/threonine protein kinase